MDTTSSVGETKQGVERPPGVCVPWAEKKAELPPITGDEQLVRRVWEETDALAYMYIWHLVVSF